MLNQVVRKRSMPVCPHCGRNDQVIPIIYGYPSDETLEAAKWGDVFLGGCMPRPAMYFCRRDQTELSSIQPRPRGARRRSRR